MFVTLIYNNNSRWSALSRGLLIFSSPDKQTSTYTSFWTMSFTSGYSSADIIAISRNPLWLISTWFYTINQYLSHFEQNYTSFLCMCGTQFLNCSTLTLNIFSWAGDRFFTKSTCPSLCNLASDSITSCLFYGDISSFLTCWLYSRGALHLLCANLLKGLNMKGKTAAVTVILLLISARTDLLVTPCSASSLMLTISVCSCYLLILHSQHLLHL